MKIEDVHCGWWVSVVGRRGMVASINYRTREVDVIFDAERRETLPCEAISLIATPIATPVWVMQDRHGHVRGVYSTRELAMEALSHRFDTHHYSLEEKAAVISQVIVDDPQTLPGGR